MQKITKRRRAVRSVKNFLNTEIKLPGILKNSRHIIGGFVSAILVISAVNIGINHSQFDSLFDSSALADSIDVQTPDDPLTGGMAEGTGVHFQVLDSQYLNITMDTVDPVKASIESVPEMILMKIEAESSDVLSTSVTLGGFLPSTTYHRYENGYTNHETFTTDTNGKYAFIQDLTDSHLIYFQPRPSTKIITNPAGGDCSTIGTWNASSKTCTLSKNVTESIEISGDGITLDGNGYRLIGTGTGLGVSVAVYRTNATIKNLNISSFSYGIFAGDSNGNTIIDNTIYSTFMAIRLTGTSNDTIERNKLDNNMNGIVLASESSNNIVRNNNIWLCNTVGILINNSSNNNIVSGNNISKCRWGINILSSQENILDSNNLVSSGTGITLFGFSSANKIVNNTVKDSTNNIGIRMYASANGNFIYNNYFNNPPNFTDATPYNNNWNIPKTPGLNIVGGSFIGGNYWGAKDGKGFSETCADADLDGFCDAPYIVKYLDTVMVTDELPLAKPDNIAPTTTIDIAGSTGLNSWYVSGVTISLAATDNAGGSGVAKTEYSFDNASWAAYSSAVSYNNEGTATIYYRSSDNAGNIETVKTVSFKIDKSAPEINGAATTESNANGWYKQSVVVRFNCNDAVSGAVSSVIDNTIGTEGSNQSSKGICTDVAGNTSELTISGINIDKTAPVVSVLRSPDANSRGWNNTPVTVTFAATDALSDLDGSSTNVVVFNDEGSGQSASYNFTDKAGNVSVASVTGINLDFTPPVLTGSASIAPNANDWYNTSVTINFTGFDVLSGLATVSPSAVLSFEGVNQEVTGVAEDYAGNTVSYKVGGINIDKTAPIITGTSLTMPNSNNWYNSDVTVRFDATDSLSGISEVSPDAVVSQEGFAQSVAGTATDKAGNTATKEVSGINLDKTSPTITGAAVNPPNDNGWYRDSAVIHFESADSLSGISSTTSDITISSEGANQVALGAAVDKAGNSANYTVDGINVDRTAPVTEAIISGDSKNNTCSITDTSITLQGTDGLSGIAGTFFNLDNAGWFSYINKLIVGIEGLHILKFNSKDRADNAENDKEVQFLVDKTPAEINIKFDPLSKDIEVYNSKTGLEAPYTVISRNISDDSEDEDNRKGWDLRRYKVLSCGDNYFVLDLMRKKEGKEATIKIVSLQQNKGKKMKFTGTSIKTEYSVENNGAIKELEQKIKAEKLFDIEAKYSANKNNSEIKVKLVNEKETKETKPGMAILVLSTDKGSFKYQY